MKYIIKFYLIAMLLCISHAYSKNYVTNASRQDISSQFDARGVDNIDCSLTKLDTVEVINSKIDALDLAVNNPCNATPIIMAGTPTAATAISGPVTLSESGHYCLSADLEITSGDAIVITGANVTLDLNGYTIYGSDYAQNGIVISGDGAQVYNGRIEGMSVSGVTITGDKTTISDVTVQGSTNGFVLNGASYNTIEQSTAACSTYAGFSLQNSSFNCLKDVQAIATQGDGAQDVFGFVSVGGQGNRFSHAVAKDTQSIVGVSDIQIAGFCLGANEQCSEISDSVVSKVRSTLDPYFEEYGYGLEYPVVEEVLEDIGTIPGYLNYESRWLVCEGRKFNAVSQILFPEGTGQLSIYEFDTETDTRSLITSYTNVIADLGGVSVIDWTIYNGRKLLAAGGNPENNPYIDDLQILEFDTTTSTISPVTSVMASDLGGDAGVVFVEWHTCGYETYLVVAAAKNTDQYSGKPIQIYRLDDVYGYDQLTLVAQYGNEIFVNSNYRFEEYRSARWVEFNGRHFIAVRYAQGLDILEFDCAYETLNFITDGSYEYPPNLVFPDEGVVSTNFTDWLVCEGRLFLAVALVNSTNAIVYEFDPVSGTLLALPNTEISLTNAITGVEWVTFDGRKFLAASTQKLSMADQIIAFYEFDTTYNELMLFDTGLVKSASTSLADLSCGLVSYLAVTSFEPPANSTEFSVFKFYNTQNIITNTAMASLYGIKASPSSSIDHIICRNLVHGVVQGQNIEGDAIGFSLNQDENLLASNKACDNTVNYALTGTAIAAEDIVKSVTNAKAYHNIDCANTDVDTSIACMPTPIITSGSVASEAVQITGPVTITTSGSYCLAADISIANGDAITIDAADVTLDLNSYTIYGNGSADRGIVINKDNVRIHNGTITHMSDSGVVVLSSNVVIDNVDSTHNTTGFSVQNADSTMIRNSRAIGNTYAGFALEKSSSSCIQSCKASNTIGELEAYGFVSSAGINNRFVDCVVDTVGVCSDYYDIEANGFALINGEQASEIIRSTVTSQSGFLFESQIDNNGPKYAARWLLANDQKYLATVGAQGVILPNSNNIEIYSFDPMLDEFATVTLVESIDPYNPVNFVVTCDWLTSGSRIFLAVGVSGLESYVDTTVLVYEFDTTMSSLTELLAINTNPYNYDSSNAVFSLEWHTCGYENYLAIGQIGNYVNDKKPVEVYRFDSNTNTLTLVADFGLSVNATFPDTWFVEWFELQGRTFIAAMGENYLWILEFDCYEESLTLISTHTFTDNFDTAIGQGSLMSWVVCDDIAYGAAARETTIDLFTFEINEYYDQYNTVYESLTLVQQIAFDAGDTPRSVLWSESCGNKILVAGVKGQTNGNNILKYTFDIGGAPYLTYNSGRFINDGYPFSFDQITCDGNIYIASQIVKPGGADSLSVVLTIFPDQISLFGIQVAADSVGNIIMNNLVHGLTGIGYKINADENYVAANTACKNTTNYDLTVTNVLLYDIVKSQVNAHAYHNVDCDNADADRATICMPTPIFTSGSVASNATQITGPVTITESGYYCLAGDISVNTGDAITINAPEVRLDLNGYTIYGNASADRGIVINETHVRVFNGMVTGMTMGGIEVSASQAELTDISSNNNTTGFLLRNADHAVIRNARATGNSYAGFALERSSSVCIQSSKAYNTIGESEAYGFVSSGGRNNRFIDCVVDTLAVCSDYYSMESSGFALLDGEQASEIINSSVTSQSGVLKESGVDNNAHMSAVRWLFTDDKKYLATVGLTDPTHPNFNLIELYQFDDVHNQLLTVTSVSSSYFNVVTNQAFACDWLTNDDRNFLAVGGNNMFGGSTLVIYDFNTTTSSLNQLSLIDTNPSLLAPGVTSLKWHACNSEKYVVIAQGHFLTANKPLAIYRFDNEVSLTLVADFGWYINIGSAFESFEDIVSLDVFELEGRTFIAAMGGDSLSILEFNCYEETLTLVNRYAYTYDPTDISQISMSWIVCNDVAYGAATRLDTIDLFTFNLDDYPYEQQFSYEYEEYPYNEYPYNENIINMEGMLERVQQITVEQAYSQLTNVLWSELCGEKVLLAGVVNSDLSNSLIRYTFDSTGMPYLTYDIGSVVGQGVFGLDQIVCGDQRYVAVTSATDVSDFNDVLTMPTTTYVLRMLPVTESLFGILVSTNSLGNIIMNNFVKGLAGTGYQMNADENYVAANTACNNTLNYDLTLTNFALSDIVKSQADARGVQNIDCNIFDADSVSVIESKVCVIDQKVDTLPVIDSKVSGLEDKINEVLYLLMNP